MSRRYCFIYNPAANPASSKVAVKLLRQRIASWEAQWIVSSDKGDIERLSREAARQFDVVVACGGDGTVREVAAGMLGSEALLGVVPVGSGNDFSKNLGIGNNLEEAIRILGEGTTKRIDVGRCNEIHFLNTLGIGFDGLSNYYATRSGLPGRWKYVWGALRSARKIAPFHATLTMDSRTEARPMLMVTLANGRIEGGMFRVAPEARIDDGLLDIVTVSAVSRILLPLLLPFFLLGVQQRLKAVEIFRADRLVIELDRPARIHADGEVVKKMETRFDVELNRSALKVIGRFG